jgi:hypothetical protein
MATSAVEVNDTTGEESKNKKPKAMEMEIKFTGDAEKVSEIKDKVVRRVWDLGKHYVYSEAAVRQALGVTE